MNAGRVRSYEGDYELYLYRKEREASPAQEERRPRVSRERPPEEAKERRRASAQGRARLKERRDAVRRVERELDREAGELRRLEAQLADPDFYANGGDDVAGTVRRHGETRERVAALESAWERLAEELAALESSA